MRKMLLSVSRVTVHGECSINGWCLLWGKETIAEEDNMPMSRFVLSNMVATGHMWSFIFELSKIR